MHIYDVKIHRGSSKADVKYKQLLVLLKPYLVCQAFYYLFCLNVSHNWPP